MKKSVFRSVLITLCCLAAFSVFGMASAEVIGNDMPVLKNISVAGYKLSPSFSPNQSEYSVVIDNDTEMLNVTAIIDYGDTYDVSGASGLKAGANIITVTVNSAGKSSVYTISAFKGVQAPAASPSVASSSTPVSSSSAPSSAAPSSSSLQAAVVSRSSAASSSFPAPSSSQSSSRASSISSVPSPVPGGVITSKPSSAKTAPLGNPQRETRFVLLVVIIISGLSALGAAAYIIVIRKLQ